jgi:hypothetical protein
VHALGFPNTEATGRVSLWIAVNNEDPDLTRGQRGRKINSRGGLSHAAFLVCDRYDSGQGLIQDGFIQQGFIQAIMFHVKHSLFT